MTTRAIILIITSCIVSGCQDEAKSSCYPISLWADRSPGDPGIPGVCRWLGDSGEDFPQRDYGDDVYLYMVGVSLELEDGEECTGCPAEDIDAMLMEEIEQQCDAPVIEFLRGCYNPLNGVPSAENRCNYTALYWSTCERPGSALN